MGTHEITLIYAWDVDIIKKKQHYNCQGGSNFLLDSKNNYLKTVSTLIEFALPIAVFPVPAKCPHDC